MRAILIVLVVLFAVTAVVAGPRITVVLQSGGGCGPVYMPRPCPAPVYRPAPPIYGNCRPQLVRCSACFQTRPVGTICPCQQRYDGGPGNPIGCNPGYGQPYNAGPPIGYNPGYNSGYNGGYDAQRRAIQAERQRLGYMDSYYRNLEQAQRDLWRAQNPYPGGGFGW